MLKGFGALLILLAPIWLSVSSYQKQRRNARLLELFEESLAFCAGQISAQRRALPELSRRMARYGPDALRPFWRSVCRALEENQADLDRIWTSALHETALDMEAIRLLEACPGILRSYDTQQVTQALGKLQSALEAHRLEKQRIFRRDFKMHTGLQVSAALLLLILLF